MKSNARMFIAVAVAAVALAHARHGAAVCIKGRKW